MGSEGYLINEFLVEHTNQRTDRWGGSPQARRRFATEIVRRVRERTGPGFLLMYRLSALDLVPDAQEFEDVLALGREVEEAGASIINTGIGWHEARIPTIATSVPGAGFTWVSRALRENLSIPISTVNRINTPELAEEVLARGDADLVCMARPFLADAAFVAKRAKHSRTGSTPASRATRRAWTTPSRVSACPAWSTRRPCGKRT